MEALGRLWKGFGDALGGFGETLGKLRGGNEEALGSFGETFKAFQSFLLLAPSIPPLHILKKDTNSRSTASAAPY